MMSFEELLGSSIKLSEGNVVVAPESLHAAVLEVIRRRAGNRQVVSIEGEDVPHREIQERLDRLASEPGICVIVGIRSFPRRLAHTGYVFNKGDGLVRPSGLTQRAHDDFCLVCLMTPRAWMSIDASMRRQLYQVTISGGHYCNLSLDDRQPLIVLEKRSSSTDPVSALREAGSLDEREEILVELFPPEEDGFVGHDRALAKIVDAVSASGDEALQRDLLEIFARHHDAYLASLALERDWAVADETLSALAAHVAVTPHLGGQRQPFWDLVKELAERGVPQARQFVLRLFENSSLVEHALRVLAELRPWPEVESHVRAALTSGDPAQRDYARRVMSALGHAPREGDAEFLTSEAMRALGNEAAPLRDEIDKLVAFQIAIQPLEVGDYPKSIRTFLRAVQSLGRSRSWVEAVAQNHITSVSRTSREYQIMVETGERLM